MATMLYAVVIYQLRAKNIRIRGQGAFDDRFGPTALAVLLFAAVVVNFVLRYVWLRGNGGLDGGNGGSGGSGRKVEGTRLELA